MFESKDVAAIAYTVSTLRALNTPLFSQALDDIEETLRYHARFNYVDEFDVLCNHLGWSPIINCIEEI